MQLEVRDIIHTTTPVGSGTGPLDVSVLNLEGPTDEDILPSFDTGFATIPNLLPEEAFSLIRQSALRDHSSNRLRLPAHKQGESVSYQSLLRTAPEIISLYKSAALQDLCSAIIGQRIQPTPPEDPVSCALLIYSHPRDHIAWHYDFNFYNGRHFTALLSLVNQGRSADSLSSAELVIKKGDEEQTVPTPPNTFVLFEGNRILHRVTRLLPDETRIILSMTFCTDPSSTFIKKAMLRVKNTGYFGIGALWR